MRGCSVCRELCSWFQILSFFFVMLSLAGYSNTTSATMTTWEVTGEVTVRHGDIPFPLNTGDQVRILVTFDSAANYTLARPSSGNRPGFRYEYSNVSSLQFEIYGGGCNPCSPASEPAYNNIYVRDSFADPLLNPSPDVPYDGISFLMGPHEANAHLGFSVILRGWAEQFLPQIIDAGAGPLLTVVPDPRFKDMNNNYAYIAYGANQLIMQLNKISEHTPPARPTFDASTGMLFFPLIRFGETAFQNVMLQLIDPTGLKFRVVDGIQVSVPGPARVWLDAELGVINVPELEVGDQTYFNVVLALTGDSPLEFAVTDGVLHDPDLPLNEWPFRGLVSYAGSVGGGGMVNVRCVTGDVASFPIRIDGQFSGVLESQASSLFPCILKMDLPTEPGMSLYSFAEKIDTDISISLLSSFTLTKVLQNDPSIAYQAIGKTVKAIDTDPLRSVFADARQFVVAGLEGFSGYQTINYTDQQTPDVFVVTSEQDRTDRDRLFKAIDVALSAAETSYAGLRDLVIENAAQREQFPDLMYDEITSRIEPTVSNVECRLLPGGAARWLRCTVIGKNLSFPALLGGKTSIIGITAARASLALPKADEHAPWQPSWCGRGAMELGSIFRSTDSDGWQSDDPLEMFAEEIEFPDCGPQITFEDDLLVEVVRDNGNLQGPGGWDLLSRPHQVVSIPPLPVGTNSINITSAVCSEVAWNYLFGTHGPIITVDGLATMTAGNLLDIFVSRTVLTEAQLLTATVDIFNSTDGILKLSSSCNSGTTICAGPATNSPFNVSPDLVMQPQYAALQLYDNWPELGIAQGQPRTLHVYALIHNFFGVAAVKSTTVNCPAPR